MKGKLSLKSIEDASVIRKFSVVFSLVSLLPFTILSSLFYLFVIKGKTSVDATIFFWAVFISGVFCIIGFIMMRNTFVYLMKVARDAQTILK